MRRATLRRICGLALLALGLLARPAAAWDDEALRQNVRLYLPEAADKVPMMFILQGSGAAGSREKGWAEWMAARGVAGVLINSAALRGRRDFSGIDSFFDYSGDVVEALRWLAQNPALDTSRFGIIGFSRGGTNVLMAGAHFRRTAPAPALAFAFYPGADARCPNEHDARTQVHVFYGEADEWGLYSGLQAACRKLAAASPQVLYHGFAGAHHQYDKPGAPGSFSAGRLTIRTEFNPDALAQTQAIIAAAMEQSWPATK